jgi:hypothetical protein
VLWPPGAPSWISVPSGTITNGSYSVSWGFGSGSVGWYELYEATNASFSGQYLAYSGGGVSAGFSKGDGTYYYRVRACNGAGCSGYTTAGNPASVLWPPGTVSQPSVSPNPTTNPYTIHWSAAAGTVHSYQYQHSFNSPSNWGAPQTATGMQLYQNQPANTTQYYRVRACNTAGCGSWSPSLGVWVQQSGGGGDPPVVPTSDPEGPPETMGGPEPAGGER